jgi:hypothetical protein
MKVIIDPPVLKQRNRINPNPPTAEQLEAVCRAINATLLKSGIKVRTFRFCIDYIPRLQEEESPGEKHKPRKGSKKTKNPQTGGFLIRLLVDGHPYAAWTMLCDKFNINTLAEETKDLADLIQLRRTGTWEYYDPNGDRRIKLGLPRELTERERREIAGDVA